MDRLRQMLQTIGGSVGSLGTTGRLLIAACVAVLVLTLVLVAVLTARPTMVALMPGASADRQREAAALATTMGIATGTSGGNVTVPADRKDALIGILGERGQLPDDTTVLFSNLAEKQNWMNPRAENERLAKTALQNELNRIISNFPSVAKAQVIIDVPETVGLGQAYRKPSASVSVWSKGGRSLTQPLVDAIAGMIAGSKSGLSPSDVRVIDGTSGRQFRTRPENDFSAGDYLEHVAKIEDRVQGKLLETLRYIGGVIVAVNASADVRRTTVSETKYLPEKQGTVSVQRSTSNKSLTSGTAGGGGEAGVRSNVAADVSTGGEGGTSTNDTDDVIESEVKIGSRQQNTIDPGGMPTKINVTVNVPREYVRDLIRIEKGDEKAEVTAAEIDAKFQAEQARISKDVQPLVETLAAGGGGNTGASAGGGAAPALMVQAGTVVVSMIPVALTGGGVASATGGGGGGGGGGVMGEWSGMIGPGLMKPVFLGVLAVGALGMMFMLVRKTAKPMDLPSAEEIVGVPPALEGEADIVGEADETQAAMEGIEIGDATLKTKRMLEQVGEMVKKNPADAAAMLNRWIQVEN